MRLVRLLFLMSVLTPFASYSQFAKGTWVPGLQLGGMLFESGTKEYTAPPPTGSYTSSVNSLGIQVSPSLGYFISDKTMLGARLLAEFQYDKYIDATNNVTFRKKEDIVGRYGLGIFARQYLYNTGKFLPWGQVNVNAGIGTMKVEGFSYTNDYRESYKGKGSGNFFISAGLQAGLTYMMNDHVGFDMSAGYLFTREKQKTHTDTYRDVGVDGNIDEHLVADIDTKSKVHGLSVSLGFVVFLKKK